MLLNLDLQMFADDDDLDIDTMLEEFEAEWDEDATETEDVEEPEEDGEPATETEEETEAPNPNDSDEHRRNQAFAELRRQAEENRKYADFIQTLASESGVSPDEILTRYQERQLQAEAEQKGIPLDYYKETRGTQSELTQLKEQLRAERMDVQIEAVKAKYGADDDSIRAAFQDMFDSGIDPRVQDNVNFEKFYRAANLDAIIQKEVENARQQDLEDKRKRQESASIGNGKSVSPSSEGDLSDDDFDAIMKSLNMRL